MKRGSIFTKTGKPEVLEFDAVLLSIQELPRSREFDREQPYAYLTNRKKSKPKLGDLNFKFKQNELVLGKNKVIKKIFPDSRLDYDCIREYFIYEQYPQIAIMFIEKDAKYYMLVECESDKKCEKLVDILKRRLSSPQRMAASKLFSQRNSITVSNLNNLVTTIPRRSVKLDDGNDTTLRSYNGKSETIREESNQDLESLNNDLESNFLPKSIRNVSMIATDMQTDPNRDAASVEVISKKDVTSMNEGPELLHSFNNQKVSSFPNRQQYNDLVINERSSSDPSQYLLKFDQVPLYVEEFDNNGTKRIYHYTNGFETNDTLSTKTEVPTRKSQHRRTTIQAYNEDSDEDDDSKFVVLRKGGFFRHGYHGNSFETDERLEYSPRQPRNNINRDSSLRYSDVMYSDGATRKKYSLKRMKNQNNFRYDQNSEADSYSYNLDRIRNPYLRYPDL